METNTRDSLIDELRAVYSEVSTRITDLDNEKTNVYDRLEKEKKKAIDRLNTVAKKTIWSKPFLYGLLWNRDFSSHIKSESLYSTPVPDDKILPVIVKYCNWITNPQTPEFFPKELSIFYHSGTRTFNIYVASSKCSICERFIKGDLKGKISNPVGEIYSEELYLLRTCFLEHVRNISRRI